jgi:hypothetical protein
MESEYNDPVTNKSSGYIATAPLHVIEIDHVKLPIKVIDEDTGYDLGEPCNCQLKIPPHEHLNIPHL